MIQFVQTSLNSLLTWSFVSGGLKKMHSSGQICSENGKQALMELPLGKVVRDLQLRNTACSPNHAQRALL